MLNTQTLVNYFPAILGAIGLAAFALYYYFKLDRALAKTPAQLEAETRAAIARENDRKLEAARITPRPRAWKTFER